jgi:hypothetical protein
MQENAALTQEVTSSMQAPSAVAAGRFPKGRGRQLDGRSYAGRRVKELTRGLLAELGGNASPLLAVRVRRVAELTATAEVLRNRALKGESIDIDKLTKLESETRRAERALGLDCKRELSVRGLSALLK